MLNKVKEKFNFLTKFFAFSKFSFLLIGVDLWVVELILGTIIRAIPILSLNDDKKSKKEQLLVLKFLIFFPLKKAKGREAKANFEFFDTGGISILKYLLLSSDSIDITAYRSPVLDRSYKKTRIFSIS